MTWTGWKGRTRRQWLKKLGFILCLQRRWCKEQEDNQLDETGCSSKQREGMHVENIAGLDTFQQDWSIEFRKKLMGDDATDAGQKQMIKGLQKPCQLIWMFQPLVPGRLV